MGFDSLSVANNDTVNGYIDTVYSSYVIQKTEGDCIEMMFGYVVVQERWYDAKPYSDIFSIKFVKIGNSSQTAPPEQFKLIRIKAMFQLIAENKSMRAVYVIFTLFLFFIEFLVVIIKLCSTNYINEDIEKARESLLRSKIKDTLEKVRYSMSLSNIFRQ